MEIIGTLIITFFNVFIIIYKMKYAPPETDKLDEDDAKHSLNDQESDTNAFRHPKNDYYMSQEEH